MPMPWTYRHPERKFRAFLEDAHERMGLVSDNSTYTAVDGVLRAFRARLTAQQVIDVAQVLPSVLRALLIEDWRIPEQPAPWADRATLAREAKALRPNHNLTPDNAIEATAWAPRLAPARPRPRPVPDRSRRRSVLGGGRRRSARAGARHPVKPPFRTVPILDSCRLRAHIRSEP